MLRSRGAKINASSFSRKYKITGTAVTDVNFLIWDPTVAKQIYFELLEKPTVTKQKGPGRGKKWKVSKKTEEAQRRHSRLIPQGYLRLLHQFILENQHGKKNNGHEAERRQMYARRMIDAFVEEIIPFDKHGPGADWRSKVLTPVLQRQLLGISDMYSWSTANGIMDAGYDNADRDFEDDTECFTDDTDDEVNVHKLRIERPRPTITQVTRAYLEFDPLDLETLPRYRRNLLYVREMRWHLGVVSLGNGAQVSHIDYFDATLQNQDLLLQFLHKTGSNVSEPLLLSELAIIVVEGHDKFYAEELCGAVCYSPPLISHSNCPILSSQMKLSTR